MLHVVIDNHVVHGLVLIGFGVLGFETVEQVVQCGGLLGTAALVEEVLLGLHGTHAVFARQPLGTSERVDDLDGLVPHLEVGEGAGIDQEHLGLRLAMQRLGIVGAHHFDGLLGIAVAAFAVGDERQVVEEAVHAVRGAELTQGELVIALTVRDEGKRLTGEIDARRLMSSPLGVGEGQFGILLLQRIGGKDVQADVLGVLLGQAAQAFTLFLGQHGPFHALGHLRLVRTTIRIGVLRRIAYRAVGIATGTVHIVLTLLLPIFALLLGGELATLAVAAVIALIARAIAITMEVTAVIATVTRVVAAAAVIATETATITILAETTLVEVTALPILVETAIPAEPALITVTTRTAMEITTITIATVVTTETTALTITTERTVTITTVIATETATITILAETTLVEVTALPILVETAIPAEPALITVTTESAAVAVLAVTARLAVTAGTSGAVTAVAV